MDRRPKACQMLPLRASRWNDLALQMRARACRFTATSLANGIRVVFITEQADAGHTCSLIGAMIGAWSASLARVLLRRPREHAFAVRWLTWGPCDIAARITAEASADRPTRGGCDHRLPPFEANRTSGRRMSPVHKGLLRSKSGRSWMTPRSLRRAALKPQNGYVAVRRS